MYQVRFLFRYILFFMFRESSEIKMKEMGIYWTYII